MFFKKPHNAINLLEPTIDWRTIWELIKTLKSGFWINGPKTKEFEEKFADYVGAKYAVAVNSATSGLDLALKVHGVKGGELITPAFTFLSDAIVGEWNDMKVVFADVDPRTFCIDIENLHLTNDTKAIIAVDCHGRLADIEGIRRKCAERGINPLIIEDAAHAMYTPGAGKGDITVWSFQGVKTMPTGDGGMITTNDEAIYKKLRTLTWLGIEKSTFQRVDGKKYTWDYDVTQSEGIKAYMIDLTAVIGLGQLRRLAKTNARRREIQKRYNEAFRGFPWFVEPEYSHTVQYYTPEWENRDGLADYLASKGIHTSVHFKPVSEFTYWKKAKVHPLPNTDAVWTKLLSLPVHNDLSNRQQRYIIKCVKEFYETA